MQFIVTIQLNGVYRVFFGPGQGEGPTSESSCQVVLVGLIQKKITLNNFVLKHQISHLCMLLQCFWM